MAANLNGIVFDQVYGDNSGGAEFDTDGDGTATQEDEFVSFTNTTGAPVDISGWQVWSDWTGSGAPDSGTDGLYHTFPSGTVLAPGQTVYVINEITGPEPAWAQEASSGGVESGAGGVSTNFLSEGQAGSGSESLVLVDPVSGDYIVFNMSSSPSTVPSQSGFPGTTNVGEVNGAAVQDDQNAGSSYQYNSATDSYEYNAVFVPCFAAGTLIRTPGGDVPVEALGPGDLVCTLDHGPQPLAAILVRKLDLTDPAHAGDKPILIGAGALGPGRPSAPLTVSPQHRMLVRLADGREALVPAKGLLHLPGIRIKRGARGVRYHHLVFTAHEVVWGNGAPSESFFGGAYALSAAPPDMRALVGPATRTPARPFLGARQLARDRPLSLGPSCPT